MGLPLLGRKPAFAFIAHPRDDADVFRASSLSLLRTLSVDDADFLARVRMLPPVVVGEVLFGFGPVRGEIVSISRPPHEVATARGRDEILQAARIMVERGAHVIGLGALTAPATNGGAWLAERLPAHVTLTNGNAYTACVVRRNVESAAAALGRAPRVAVVGCTGSVGQALSRLLAGGCAELVLIGRVRAKVERLFGDLAPVARFSEQIADAADADVVVALTSDDTARLTPDVLRDGAIVIDVAEPPNVSDADAEAWAERVIVVRGGRVRIPGYRCTYDFGLERADETFACLAETYLFAREGIRGHSVEAPSVAFAERLERVACKHGLEPQFVVPEGPHEVADSRRVVRLL